MKTLTTKKVSKRINKRSFSVLKMTEGGRKLKKYSSMKEAERMTGVNSGSISKATRGLIKSAGGFRWKLA